MKTFEIYYSGVIEIEAEDEEDAVIQFERNYWDYGSIDSIDLIGDEEEVEEDEKILD